MREVDRQVRDRASLVVRMYSMALAGAFGLLLFFPFPLSRAGGAILVMALLYMVLKVRATTRRNCHKPGADQSDAASETLTKVAAQIELCQSVFYNLPFLVGANLFFMGLPGPGSEEGKARLNCLFLAATVMVFTASYFLNQKILTRRLVQLRRKLESVT